jgi:hypothetical protein
VAGRAGAGAGAVSRCCGWHCCSMVPVQEVVGWSVEDMGVAGCIPRGFPAAQASQHFAVVLLAPSEYRASHFDGKKAVGVWLKGPRPYEDVAAGVSRVTWHVCSHGSSPIDLPASSCS